ncbi:MAG: hypothetical protein MJ176_03170 [Treponema sp.]|nr:hypothetical protein [Treponema sp.]
MELDQNSKKDTSALCMKNHYKLNDELYTPVKLVKILLPFLEIWAKDFIQNQGRNPVIWCPFDTEDSEFVRVFQEYGYTVTYSHLNTNQNFFEYEPEVWDIAISNPPFSQKMDIFKRLFNFNKPFVMLCNEMIINYQIVANLFTKYEIQLLAPDKKVSFNGKTSSFATGYFCWNFLPKDLVFVHMEDNNSGKNFEPAKMFKDKQKPK